MRPIRKPWGIDPELLDPEAWDCPARLSPDDCLEETGPDWRWTQARPDELEEQE